MRGLKYKTKKEKIKRRPLDDIDYDVILGLAANRMQVAPTSKKLHIYYNTVLYRIQKIKDLTGLDATNFYDLCELVLMAKEAGFESYTV